MKTLRQLIPNDTLAISGNLDVEIEQIAYDSRQVKPGSLFVALDGANIDGHSFINEAIKKGAVAVVVEKEMGPPNGCIPEGGSPVVPMVRVQNSRSSLSKMANLFFDHPSGRVPLIGVTGTKGKTTTTYLIQSVLKKAWGQAYRFGTVEHDLGFTVKPAKNTTPESLDLMTLMHEAIQGGAKAGVMEVSSHALKTSRVNDLTFAAVGFTNLSMEHTEFHPTMEDYYQAKRRLFLELLPKGKTGVVCIDSEYGLRLAKECREKGLAILTISLDQTTADMYAEAISISGTESAFVIVANGAKFPCRIHLPGHFNVVNALLAAGLARAVGIEWPSILAGIQELLRVPGRFETVPNGRKLTVIVDYAHSPASLENVLKAVRPLASRRVITVFGCGGNRSHEKRPVMGRLSAELSDVTIVTSDNPRKERPEDIISQIMTGVNPVAETLKKEIHVEADRRKAIGLAVAMANPGDVVLIAGKGHETGQTFADRTIPFDDREVAREFLEGKNHG